MAPVAVAGEPASLRAGPETRSRSRPHLASSGEDDVENSLRPECLPEQRAPRYGAECITEVGGEHHIGRVEVQASHPTIIIDDDALDATSEHVGCSV